MAAGDEESPSSASALEQLCRAYWQPLYWHVRRQGCSATDAPDLIQAFFAYVLEKRLIGAADRERGKFRTFLLTALRNFQANERERAQAVKRGGGRVFAMDFRTAEDAFQFEPSHDATPELDFERRWAIAVLEEALTTLGKQQHAEGKGPLFELLAPCLTASDDAPRFAEISTHLGLSIAAVKKAASRLRAQYARAIRDEVERTIATNESVDEEIKSLFRAVQVHA